MENLKSFQNIINLVFKHHYDKLIKVSFRICKNLDDANDIVQEVLIKISSEPEKYKGEIVFPSSFPLKNNHPFFAYIITAVKRKSINIRNLSKTNTSKYSKHSNLEDTEKTYSNFSKSSKSSNYFSFNMETILDNPNLDELLYIKSCFPALNNLQKDLIIGVLEEKTYEEIAFEKNIPTGSVRSSLSRAKKIISKSLLAANQN